MSRRGNKKTFLLISALIIACISLLVFFSACIGEEAFWFTDPPTRFHTNDVERAQQEIPFTIILPTYLPDDIKPRPYMIEGPVKGTSAEDSVEISITYFAGDNGYRSIYIDELNRPVTAYPPNSGSSYLDIAGIQVLEYEISSMMIDSSGTGYIQGFSYAWNRDGVHFHVHIYEYERDEGRKIIESMVKQME